ncbi:hypothetical protein CJU89_4048 [Yarrowia sp. B02]|nr:hypothetical protein CJU89_4048 [Yarrowia sp. B02]
MNSDEVLKASLATILYIRGVFDSSSYSVSVTPDGAPYMTFLRGHDGVSLVCDWINYACNAFSTGNVSRFVMQFSRTDSEALEEYTLTSEQLRSIADHPGMYFKSLASELETYQDMTTEVGSDGLLVVSISLEFVPGYPQDLQRGFRGIFRTVNAFNRGVN